MSKKLKVGDVFELKKGMRIYAEIPCRFVYTNTPYSSEITAREVSVGETYSIAGKKCSKNKIINQILKHIKDYSDFDGVSFDKKKLEEAISIPEQEEKFHTNQFIGEYVVVKTQNTGGGTGHGPHDYYPDGWHVTARKLKNGKFDKKGLKISFYQDGCFTVVNENVPVVRKMVMTFS